MAGPDWAIEGVVSGSGPFLGECCEASRHQHATRGTRALVEGTFTSPVLLDA